MFKRVTGEQALIKRMLKGDQQAFTSFFDEYFPRLYRFALVRLKNDARAAEDVAQATLCTAIDKLDTFRGEAAIFTWMCTICRYEISAWYRKNQRYQESPSLAEDDDDLRSVLESLTSLEADQTEIMQRKEVIRLVHVTLDHLKPNHRKVLMLKYIQDRPVQEIADELELKLKATESLLTRARQAFRDGFQALVTQLNTGGLT